MFDRKTSRLVLINVILLVSAATSDGVDDGTGERRRRDSSEMEPWTHSQMLDRDGSLILRWQPRHQEISFRIEARTRGYVGIGFSPTGAMEGADILIGWVDDADSKPHLLVGIRYNQQNELKRRSEFLQLSTCVRCFN